MFDGNMASRAITQTLSADSTLSALVTAVVEGDYKKAETEPEDAYPFINIVYTAPSDVYYNGAVRAKTDQNIMIYGIQRFKNNASYLGTLQSIAERIETLLHGQCVTVTDPDTSLAIGSAYFNRESPIRERFVDGSIEYRYLGGIYQVNTKTY